MLINYTYYYKPVSFKGQKLHKYLILYLEIGEANLLDLLLAVTADAVAMCGLDRAPLEQLHHERVGELGAREIQDLHDHLEGRSGTIVGGITISIK